MTRYAKTIVALLGALATWGVTAAEDSAYTQAELWGALLALATAAGVYAWPNTPPKGEPADPEVSEQGHLDLGTALVAVAVIALGIVLAQLILGLL